MMNKTRQRRLVVEVERMQMIRKWISTKFFDCGSCGREVDFVTVCEAAQIFEISDAELGSFLKSNDCHSSTYTGSEQHICLRSLMKSLNLTTGKHEVRLFLGEKNNNANYI